MLDAAAILALLQGEPGAAEIAQHLPGAHVSAVNLSEAVAKLVEAGVPPKEAEKALEGLGLRVVSFDTSAAYEAAALRPATRRLGLSLGDRACLGLAARLRLPAVTTDRTWRGLSGIAQVQVVGRGG